MTKIFSFKWTTSVIVFTFIIIVLLMATGETANGQVIDAERGKTVSAGRDKKRSFYYIVCVRTESGRMYSIKYQVHCWTCPANIPQTWDVISFRRKTIIKPVI